MGDIESQMPDVNSKINTLEDMVDKIQTKISIIKDAMTPQVQQQLQLVTGGRRRRSRRGKRPRKSRRSRRH